MDGIPFSAVLRQLERHGWRLSRIWTPYRVFEKPGELPFMLKVEPSGLVSYEYAEKVNELLREDEIP